jgi:hypothetical protein
MHLRLNVKSLNQGLNIHCSAFDPLSRTSLVFAVRLEAWEQTHVACWLKLCCHCVRPLVDGGAPPTDVIYQTLVYRGWDLTFMIMPPWGLESVDLLQMLSVEVQSRHLFLYLVHHRLRQRNSSFCTPIAYTALYFVTPHEKKVISAPHSVVHEFFSDCIWPSTVDKAYISRPYVASDWVGVGAPQHGRLY